MRMEIFPENKPDLMCLKSGHSLKLQKTNTSEKESLLK
jgi:hypothetical protein